MLVISAAMIGVLGFAMLASTGVFNNIFGWYNVSTYYNDPTVEVHASHNLEVRFGLPLVTGTITDPASGQSIRCYMTLGGNWRAEYNSTHWLEVTEFWFQTDVMMMTGEVPLYNGEAVTFNMLEVSAVRTFVDAGTYTYIIVNVLAGNIEGTLHIGAVERNAGIALPAGWYPVNLALDPIVVAAGGTTVYEFENIIDLLFD